MNALKHFLGTGFYSGLIPKAPGTAGSTVAVFIIFGIIYAQVYPWLLLFLILTSLISFWVTPYFEQEFGNDPELMVIDEWAGQSMTFIVISFTGNLQTDIIILLTGFIFFRIFDILKPLGINKLQNLEGWFGILADDLLAGLYALICLKTLIFTWPNLFGMT
ncbi:MAG: phosphatidylglycerophosphatase A [Gracilimonas sp.]|uniref:phosphatidylglycerophosphatase A family protein n=1 Tax=Gracilimonas sp. TaxID=1974203 RepID=UPI0019AD6313|nr:phosphatidylglycerophosphatase A [Gracilimonas sp.]MBD3615466.1 phosphatidylglycerophosphatase A [Gracilimonas sp.]